MTAARFVVSDKYSFITLFQTQDSIHIHEYHVYFVIVLIIILLLLRVLYCWSRFIKFQLPSCL